MNPDTLAPLLDTAAWRSLQSDLVAAGQRRLVLLEGARELSRQWLEALLPVLELMKDGIWVGEASDAPDSRLVSIKAAPARERLGQGAAWGEWEGWRGERPGG